MKKITLLFAISAFLMVACDAPKENEVKERESLMRTDTFPNGTVAYNDMDWEFKLIDTTAKHAYLGFNEKGQGTYLTKDSTWKKEVRIPRSTFWVKMGKKTVSTMMSVSDYFTKDVVIASLLLILLIILIRAFIKGDWMRFMGKGGSLGFILVAYIGTILYLVTTRPNELAGNNVKQLTRAEYEYWMKKDPTFNEFWKEKWEANELMGITNKAALK